MLVRTGGVRRGRSARGIVRSLFEAELRGMGNSADPEQFWSVRPTACPKAGETQLIFVGAVLVRLPG